ncbi:MAG: hypothetical protein LUF85_13135 [Bacteroides sp.]|nr:hypothetical protein [Bacteroides sp.]
MKVSNFIATLLFFTLLAGCDKNTTSDEPRGGWYVISDQNKIMGDALFNRYDIDQIWIETSPDSGSKSVYIVTGSFTPDATARLSAFTQQHIGKRFGFVLDKEIITSERIEQSWEEGWFSIPFRKKSKARKAYESLLIGK